MNWESIETNWARYKHEVREQWSRLATERLDEISGRRDDLSREIQTAYGLSKHAAGWQLSGWQKRRNAPVVIAG